MPVVIGDWNVGGPASGASGAMKRIREKWAAAEQAADPDADLSWMEAEATAAPIARMVQAIAEGYHEELKANGSVGGVTAGGATVTGTIL